jgi:type III pantothenate kinase
MSRRALLVDIGNSRLKWALASLASGPGPVESCEHDNTLPDAIGEKWAAIDRPQQLLVSSVAGGGIVDQLGELAWNLWGIEMQLPVSEKEYAGLVNCYAHPERLGIDRWLAMIGARESITGPVCVVDAGTALTIDVVDASGRHRGGLILPGIDLMTGSLQSGTAIPDYSEPLAGAMLGCSTVNAIQLGSLQALGSLVDRVANGSSIEGLRLLLTGGDAARVASVIEYPVEHIPDLVFRGLMTFIETD